MSEADRKAIWEFAEKRNTMITRQIEQYRLKSARIITPTGYIPEEVYVLWESLDAAPVRKHFSSRGFLSEQKKYFEYSKTNEDDWRHFTYTMSDDCELVAFVSESIEIGHSMDVITFESVQYQKAIFHVAFEKNEHHGSIFITGPHSHFKFSAGPDRKLLYFARPRSDQRKTCCGKNRNFVICVYDFDTKGVVVVTDENICLKPINAVEWTPDNRGIVFHRDGDLLWHRFGDKYINVLYKNCPAPLKITFSPGDGRLAVFLPTSFNKDSQILLFHWPLVKAALTYQHDVISLGEHRVWSVPDRPWANGGKDLIFNANWQHNVVSYMLQTATRELQKITFPKPAVIVDVQEHEILFETVSANSKSRLWYTSLESMNEENPEFRASLLTAPRLIDDDEDPYHAFDVKHMYFDKAAYTGVLYMPVEGFKPGKKLEMIVIPYAGTKPNFTDLDQEAMYSAFVNCGFCVLIVNNRHATIQLDDGYPEKVDLCVADDVHAAVLETLEQNRDRIDEEGICLYGADYASFIVSSIIVKYPLFYKSASLIRPHVEFPTHAELTEAEMIYLKEYTAFEQPSKVRIPILLMVDDDETCSEFRQSLLTAGVICYKETVREEEMQSVFIHRVTDFLEDPVGEEIASEAEKMLDKLEVS
ncbi:unnamed protein product [Caenorhabditis brenneri]